MFNASLTEAILNTRIYYAKYVSFIMYVALHFLRLMFFFFPIILLYMPLTIKYIQLLLTFKCVVKL